MLLKEETEKRYGYSTESLSRTSDMPIWWKCDKCHEEREYAFAYYNKKHEESQNNGSLEICQKCAHEHRKGTVSSKKCEGQAWQELPPEVEIQMTLERYGYDPRDLSPWSRKLIIVTCPVTGVTTDIKRCGINTSKSVIETGHYASVGACTAKRRAGVKVSSETKEQMKLAQQQRREKEKFEKQNKENKTNTSVWGSSQWQSEKR